VVENIEPYEALKSLSIEEQTLLSYLYFKEKIHSEIAKQYKLGRSSISKRIAKILDKIKLFFVQ